MKHTLLLLVMLCLPLYAGAQDVLIVTEEWPPYNHSENGEVTGVVTEIVKAVMARTGLDFQIRVYPWARAYKMAMEIENVMIYSIFRLDNREHLFKWIAIPGLSVEMYLFKPRHRTDIQVKDIEDVKAYTVGVTRDTSTHHFLLAKGFEENKNLIPLPSEEQNILMTLPDAKRTDFSTGDRLSLARWLRITGLPHDYLEKQVFLFKEDIYFAFGPKTSDAVVDTVRRAVDELAAEGGLVRILNEHCQALGVPPQ